MPTPQDIGARIRNRLRVLGYWKEGRPDVSRFCRENGHLPQYIYAWLKGRVPRTEHLMRLGAQLGVPPAWLLFGDRPIDGWIGGEVHQLIRPVGRAGPGGRGRTAAGRPVIEGGAGLAARRNGQSSGPPRRNSHRETLGEGVR